MGEGKPWLSTPGPLFLSDPHSGSFSMRHLWGHSALVMALKSDKCASSLISDLNQDDGKKGQRDKDGGGRGSGWATVRNTNVTQTETLEELIYIPEEGVCTNACDVCVL